MSNFCFSSLAALVVSLSATPSLAQHAPAPTEYTVTIVNALFGTPIIMTIYRDGQVAVMDHPASHVRSYTNLAKGRSYSWSTTEAAPACGAATFSGDWGDPFGGDLSSDLSKMKSKEVGIEVVNGIRTRVLEATNPQGGPPYRLWIDQTYGEVVKLVGAMGTGPVGTLIEIKSLTLGKPPASVFVMTPECAKVAAQPDQAGPAKSPKQTEAEAIAAATGRDPSHYIRGTFGPGSNETCSVLFSVVQRGTLAPIAVPFRAGIDPTVDIEHPAHYEMGGQPLFKGGGLHEVTSQFHGGVARLNGLTANIDVEVLYGNPGAEPFTFSGHANSANIYKRCFGKKAAKLYLVVDAAKLSEPAEWLWEK